LDLSQILAIVIFLLMFIAIIIGKVHRYIPALIGAGLVIIVVFLVVMRSSEAVTSVLGFGQLGEVRFWVPGHEPYKSHGVNWQTIIFIAGMMLMVEGLGAVGFFRWLCLYVAKLVRYQVVPILISFMLLSGFLSMFIDSITVLLFMSSVTIELGRLLKFDPVPVVIAEIFAANVGGSATMMGDPPNVIIGTAFGYTFNDFLTNTGPIAWIGMIVTLLVFFFLFRKILAPSREVSTGVLGTEYPQPGEAISNLRQFIISAGILFITVALLVTHAQTGLSVATVGCIAAALTLLAAGKGASHLIGIFDWRTLLFFIGLFVCVGGLEETGVLSKLAEYIGSVSGGSPMIVLSIILWLSAFASAIVDNIPFAATMVPVLHNLSQMPGLNLPPLAWSLALGADIGGNGTPIGASANVVGTAIAEREGYPISWGRFLKYALPAMILVVLLCNVYLILRYVGL